MWHTRTLEAAETQPALILLTTCTMLHVVGLDSLFPVALHCAHAGGGTDVVTVTAPGGFQFVVVDEDVAPGASTMTELCLRVSDLDKSIGEMLPCLLQTMECQYCARQSTRQQVRQCPNS